MLLKVQKVILLKKFLFFSLLFFTLFWGGDNVLLTHFKRFLRFCNKKLSIKQQISNFTDKRKKYQIPLANIFSSMFFSTLLNFPTFLAKDYLNRSPFFKNFLNCDREMVASDTTLIRNLSNNLNPKEVGNINYGIAKQIPELLINPFLNKRCGILDGSGFGHYLYEVLIVPGVIDFILNFTEIEKRGKELNAAAELIKDTKEKFGAGFFDLILGDGLYYTGEKFKLCIEELKAHLFVKTSERLNVVKDVEFYIENNAPEVETVKGFDNERLCNFTIKMVKNIKAETVAYPLQVAIITEEYIKPRKSGQIETFYVITSDLSLTPLELRYAAHLRWRIENNGFKELNNLIESKRKRTKDKTCCLNILWIMFIAYNLFHLFLNRMDVKKESGTVVVTLNYWLKRFYDILIIAYSRKSIFR